MDDVAAAACKSERRADNSVVFSAFSLHQSVVVQPPDCTQLHAVHEGNRPAADPSTSPSGNVG